MKLIEDRRFVAWCVLGVYSGVISAGRACELLGISLNEWRSLDIPIEEAKRLLSVISAGSLEVRDLVLALQEHPRYHTISVFADDLSMMARDSVAHGLVQHKAVYEGFHFSVLPEHGLVRLNRGTYLDTSINDLGDAVQKAAQLKEGFKTDIFGLLIGDKLSQAPESPRKIFTLLFDPIYKKWGVYDGGLLKWMKEKLLPKVIVSSEILPKVPSEEVAEAVGAELTRPRQLGKLEPVDLVQSLYGLARNYGGFMVNVHRDGFDSVIGMLELPDHKYVSISAVGSGKTRNEIDDDIYRKLGKKMANWLR
jgi:hypothetical protein